MAAQVVEIADIIREGKKVRTISIQTLELTHLLHNSYVPGKKLKGPEGVPVGRRGFRKSGLRGECAGRALFW